MDNIEDLTSDMIDGSINVDTISVEEAIATGNIEYLLAMIGAGYDVEESALLDAFTNAIDERSESTIIGLLNHMNTAMIGREGLETILHYALDTEKYDIADYILENTSLTVPVSYLKGLVEIMDLTTLQMYLDESTEPDVIQELIDYALELSAYEDHSDEIIDILTFLEELL